MTEVVQDRLAVYLFQSLMAHSMTSKQQGSNLAAANTHNSFWHTFIPAVHMTYATKAYTSQLLLQALPGKQPTNAFKGSVPLLRRPLKITHSSTVPDHKTGPEHMQTEQLHTTTYGTLISLLHTARDLRSPLCTA